MRDIIQCAKQTLGMGGPEPWATEMGLRLAPFDDPEHCGIWGRAIWRRCGFDVPDWKIGRANTWYLTRIDRPNSGDLIEWRFGGHQSLFDRFEDGGRIVVSVDANTIDDATGEIGVVAVKRRDVSEVLGYRRAPYVDPEGDTLPPGPPEVEPVPFDPRPLEAWEESWL